VKTFSLSCILVATALAAHGGVGLTTLVSFGGTNGYYPEAGFIQTADGNLYGTIEAPYISTILPYLYQLGFRLTTNGILTPFNVGVLDNALSKWVQRKYDGNVYCTGIVGTGTSGGGAVWEFNTNGINTNGTSGFPLGFPVFFDGANGANPSPFAGLIEGNDGNFYGTTTAGGSNGYGTIFQITFNGRIASLYSFSGGNDGANPIGALVQASSGTFYGTTAEGGLNNAGTVFSLTTNGTLTTIYSFSGGDDGYYPATALVQGRDGYLYGTTEYGGTFNVQNEGCGTVFKIATNGSLTTLFSFNGINGANPVAPLIQATDGNFYGTTAGGGNTNSLNMANPNGSGGISGGIFANGSGTIFKITPSGAFTTIYSFAPVTHGPGGYINADGAAPTAALLQGVDGNFYGTTLFGGTNGAGTAFRLSITPDPSLEFTSASLIGNIIILSWIATPGRNYQVQSSYTLTQTNWMNCGSLIMATNSTAAASDSVDQTACRFYRVLLVQ
jgi:uncharacterized repeat protein (TIGR03803 family)